MWLWIIALIGCLAVTAATAAPPQSKPVAFYVAPNGRFLASHYRGTRNGGLGVRVVREIHGPDSYGPIYNIKTNHLGPGPYVNWPWYATSPDRGFVEAFLLTGTYRILQPQNSSPLDFAPREFTCASLLILNQVDWCTAQHRRSTGGRDCPDPPVWPLPESTRSNS